MSTKTTLSGSSANMLMDDGIRVDMYLFALKARVYLFILSERPGFAIALV